MWTIIGLGLIAITINTIVLIYNGSVIRKLKRRSSPSVYLQSRDSYNKLIDLKLSNRCMIRFYLLIFLIATILFTTVYAVWYNHTKINEKQRISR